MATWQTTAAEAEELVDVTQAGIVVTRIAKFVATAEMAIGSVIEMVRIPKGAIVTGIQIANSAFGTGALIDVGDVVDPDRFMDGVSVVAAGSKELFEDGIIGNIFFKYEEEDTIDITAMVAVIPDEAVIVMKVEYKMEDSAFDDENGIAVLAA